MTEAEGHDALLDQLARLVGHPGWPPLPRPEHLDARAHHGTTPPVVGRVVDPEDAARLTHVPQLGREAEQPQPEPEQDVIIDHGADPPAHGFKHHKHEDSAPLAIGRAGSQVSGELGDCSP
jgi:hypothetical protein